MLCRLDGGTLVGTQPATPVVTAPGTAAPGTGISEDVQSTGTQDASALGERL